MDVVLQHSCPLMEGLPTGSALGSKTSWKWTQTAAWAVGLAERPARSEGGSGPVTPQPHHWTSPSAFAELCSAPHYWAVSLTVLQHPPCMHGFSSGSWEPGWDGREMAGSREGSWCGRGCFQNSQSANLRGASLESRCWAGPAVSVGQPHRLLQVRWAATKCLSPLQRATQEPQPDHQPQRWALVLARAKLHLRRCWALCKCSQALDLSTVHLLGRLRQGLVPLSLP